MASQPYIRKLEIKDYKVLKRLELPVLRRITVIGGRNGTGKTTVLDAVFQFMDSYGPLPLFSASQKRGIPLSIDNESVNIGSDGSCFKFGTNKGDYEVNIRKEDRYIPSVRTVNQNGVNKIEASYLNNEAQKGISYVLNKDNTEKLHVFTYQENLNTVQMVNMTAIEKPDEKIYSDFPLCAFLNSVNLNNVNEITERFSDIIKMGKRPYLIENINKIFDTNIKNMELLDIGGIKLIHADVDGIMVPISNLGSGVLCCVSIITALMKVANGVLVLDEFESSIHYSKLNEIWAYIYEVSKQNNSQVLCVTHSKECLIAAASIITNKNDFIYYRLDKVGGDVFKTDYYQNELTIENVSDWEFR
jgi:AAA15 family ATPase/GTPase